jgi:hypothetical protein
MYIEEQTDWFSQKKETAEPIKTEDNQVLGFKIPNLIEILKGELDESSSTRLSRAKN